ncbi:hypothetical protein M9Y10_026920 [Tritrichomonas musculus]|uniref:Protein kinase domain-containing protein n=1 Tax=Tritrichomonas musculus TaxID=1915356 RepID=A0ABR2H6W1_9EUKA
MPKDLEDGIQIFEQEAFLNIKLRHMNPILHKKITSQIFSDAQKQFSKNYDSYAPNQMIINATSKVTLATPMYMAYISLKKKIKTYRIMRAFIELNIIAKNPNDSFVVYSLYATPEEWRIFIKGPKNTPYADKWLSLYMVLPKNYPIEPPRFRFITIPFHPNVSSEGTVLFNMNDRDYTSPMGIDAIIAGIIKILEKPDVNYPINRKAMELYLNNNNEFKTRQKNGETGCKDYKQYLKDVKIYSKIPVNTVVPKEDRTKSSVISLTKDAVNKAAEKGGEVDDQCLLDINDFELIEELGSGGFGVVYLVRDKHTGFEFAAKVAKNTMKNTNDAESRAIIDYIKEVNVMSNFNHGSIMKVYGYCLKDFHNDDKQVIIMENVPNGDLRKIIEDERKKRKREGWDDTQKLISLYGIASGMAYSLSYGIAHSDLKPENILMTNDLCPKISDFDTARMEKEGFSQSFNMSGSEITSPLYSAPEVIECDEGYEKYAEKSDVYSFAIITYEVITALEPFPNLSHLNLYRAVVQGQRPKIPKEIKSHYKELIKICWKQYPNDRPSFSEIVNILKSDDFLPDDENDRLRFTKYVNYIENYKDMLTVSQYNRPRTRADKRKSEKKLDDDDVDQVMKQSASITILNLKEYKEGDVLGRGRFSQVVQVTQRKTGKIFAAKISLQRVSKEVSLNILSEINIIKQLDYPSILKFIGYSPVDFENNPKPTIVTEYSSNGSLQDIINDPSKYPKWDETKKLIIVYGIVAGMKYLHEHKILHNDLKPSNILLNEHFYPKIADFGLSQFIENENDFNSSKSHNIKGTPSYISPEIWNDRIYNEASDVYAFGILLYELAFMKKAFVGMMPFQIGYKVTNNERPPLDLSKSKSNMFISMIEKCWAQDPKKRPSFKELLVELQDKKYLSKDINQGEYKKYIQLLKNFK